MIKFYAGADLAPAILNLEEELIWQQQQSTFQKAEKSVII